MASIVKKKNQIMGATPIKRKGVSIKKLQSIMKVNNKSKEESTGIDPTVMFTRMIVVAVREGGLEPFFEYELTTDPMPLLK